MSTDLLDYVTNLFLAGGWHRISPVRNTLIIESPTSEGSLYLELQATDEKIVDAAIYPPEQPDPEFERLAHDLIVRFHIHATNA